jgi:signal transduction histidine kinase
MARRVARNVHVILVTSVGLVLLVAGTLGWLGWRLLSQEEALLRQRSHDRLEQSADLLLAGFLRSLAETESWLGQIGSTLPPEGASPPHRGGILVKFSRSGVETQPPNSLPYYPVSPASSNLDPALFREAELLEFQTGDLRGAAAILLRLAESKEPHVRDEALLRLARVQSKSGNVASALETYGKLRDENLMSPAEAPYALLSRFARCQLLANSHDDAAARQEASKLLADLESARFVLGKESYAWYNTSTRQLAGVSNQQSTGVNLAVAAMVESIWDDWQIFQRSGSRSLTKRLHDSSPVHALAVLNANPERLVTLIYAGESLRDLVLDSSASGSQERIRAALIDEHEQPISGEKLEASELQATRILSAADLPWRLNVAASSGDSTEGLLAARRGYFVVAIVLIILLVCAASYAMARGVLRETAAARLQSDFVSTVSHEFRSPLTTLRQLTELLADGRIHDESRRRLYFEVLQKETSRLHQLVEGLLDFGRMDAGKRQYRLEPIDFAELVRDGIEEYQSESNSNGHKIELASKDTPLVVNADREALRRVLRNLLENAVKYSPDCPTVWVETGLEERAAVLRVTDRGIGIPPEERSRIFEKFVRGEGAKRACIQGTGIGLAMVKEIVHVHQGDVDLSSEVGQGSTFRVRLPLSRSFEESQ